MSVTRYQSIAVARLVRHGLRVVVDYKTDAVEAPDVERYAARYRLQVGAYALALQRATRRPVREAVLLFLAPGREVVFRDVEGLAREAEAAAAAVVGP